MSVGKVADFISLVNFEWHGQTKVGNIAIFVLWRDREKIWCMKMYLDKKDLVTMMPIKWLAGAAPEHIHKLCVILKCTEVDEQSGISVNRSFLIAIKF